MTEVTRYDLTQDIETGQYDITPVPASDQGKFVIYDDYLAERQQREAAEKELAALLVDSVQTPNTDAAIAEIKAQGVDELADHMKLNGFTNEASGTREFAANMRAGRKG